VFLGGVLGRLVINPVPGGGPISSVGPGANGEDSVVQVYGKGDGVVKVVEENRSFGGIGSLREDIGKGWGLGM